MNGQCLTDALAQLRKEGRTKATRPRIKYAIHVGYVDRPVLNGDSRYVIVGHNINQFRRYLDNVPLPGPRRGSKLKPRTAAAI